MSFLIRVFMASAIALATFALTACASSDRPVCNVTADCEEAQQCLDGYCEDDESVECTTDQHCDTGYSCEANSCVLDEPVENQTNQSENQSTNQSTNQTNNQTTTNQTDNQSNGIDPGNPRVETIYPPDGAQDVATDVTILVTFDRPIAYEFGRLNSDGLFLRSPAGVKIPATLAYREDEREASLTPNQPLLPGTRYTVNVGEAIMDASETFPLFEEVTTYFVTAYEIDGDLQAMAELFAPVIYQETRQTGSAAGINGDIPTRIDFDGDFDANNNQASAAQASTSVPAHVYYSVASTESHYFIHYILYYPTRRIGSGGATVVNEHSFTGIVVVVDRETWGVELIEGVRTSQDSSQDRALPTRPNTSSVTTRGSHEIIEFDSSLLIGGSHYPLYVPSGNHAGCFWHDRLSYSFFVSPCPDTPGEFVGGEGIILTLGDQAQTINDAEESEDNANHLEMTYTLLPFIEPFWTHRGDYECGLFTPIGFTYSPYSTGGDDPLVGPNGQALHLPRSLCSNDIDSYGRLPYRWFGAASSGGEWFLDPAMALNQRFNFGDGYSQDYCDNLYFNIDRSGEPECGVNGD